MLFEEKVVEVKPPEVELELQQRRANVLVSYEGPHGNVDGFYVAPASELQQSQNVAYTANTASRVQNESSQTSAQTSTVSTQDMTVNKNQARKGVKVETMHISCKSDPYIKGHNYAGVIIYQYEDKSEWKTKNGTHCKSGYIVIQDTDSNNVKKWSKEPGKVHGAVYRNAFRESVNKAYVVGEGFALRKGTLEIRSGVFNMKSKNNKSEHHDNTKRMHEISEHCIRKVVKHWKDAGPSWVYKRTFEVKELMSDLNSDFLMDSDMKTRGQKHRNERKTSCSIL